MASDKKSLFKKLRDKLSGMFGPSKTGIANQASIQSARSSFFNQLEALTPKGKKPDPFAGGPGQGKVEKQAENYKPPTAWSKEASTFGGDPAAINAYKPTGSVAFSYGPKKGLASLEVDGGKSKQARAENLHANQDDYQLGPKAPVSKERSLDDVDMARDLPSSKAAKGPKADPAAAKESKALNYGPNEKAPKQKELPKGLGPTAFSDEGTPLGIKMPNDKGKQGSAMGLKAEDLNPNAMASSSLLSKNHFDTKIKNKVALSLRYRIPTKLSKLDNKTIKKLADYIMEQIEVGRRNRDPFMQRLSEYRENWKNFDIAGLNLTIEGQHDEHVPVVFEKGKTMHARIYQAVFGVEPPFSLLPRKAVDEKQKQEKEDLMRWVLSDYMNYGNGIQPASDLDIQNFVFDGTSICKHYWTRDVRKYVGVDIKEKQPLELDENGQLVVEEIETERENVIYDGPIMKPMRLEDVLITGALIEDIDQADLVDHCQQYTKSDLIKMCNLGFFKKEWVDHVLEKASPSQDWISKGRDRLLDQQTERLIGIRQEDVGIPSYTVHESYLRYDIDNDGIDEELVVWVEEQTKTIIRITYLDRVSQNGKRPFVLKKLIPVEGSPYGIGFAEMLNGINNLTDYVVNQRLDAGTFQTFPWFVFRASSGMTGEDIRIAPGKGIPVDNIQDIAFPRVNGNPAYGYQEEQVINTYAEKVSGITSLAQGQIAGQGATRTATGAAALVQELNTNLDIFIKRYQTGYKKSLKIIDKQIQELLPLGLEYHVLGMKAGYGGCAQKRFEDRESIAWDTDFELTGNSVNSNKAIERDTAMQILQMSLNPIMLQSGIVGPQQVYNAFKNFLQKLEVRDTDAYAMAPEGVQGSPYSALDEINMIMAGVKPPISMNDKHAEKLAIFEQFEQSDEFGLFTQDHLPLYSEVKMAHQQYADAIAAQGQVAANSGGFVSPQLGAQVMGAAGSGNPQGGVPNQVADLMAQSSTLQS